MRISFSRIEIRHLLKAWLLTSVTFAIGIAGLHMTTLVFLPVALVTAGIGIILHELAHKIVAAREGIHSEFRAFDMMLLASVVMAVFGFIFLAPGAVFMGQQVDARRNGKIALAGPLTNIVIAALTGVAIIVFLPFFPILFGEGTLTYALTEGFMFIFQVNAWLGLFNMLPFLGMDGEKVLAWKPSVFWATVISAAAIVFLGFYYI